MLSPVIELIFVQATYLSVNHKSYNMRREYYNGLVELAMPGIEQKAEFSETCEAATARNVSEKCPLELGK